MKLEVWGPVEGWSKYEVSNMGRIRSFNGNSKEPKLRTLIKTQQGYLKVIFYDGKNRNKTFIVSRLVASAFLQKPEDCDQVAHLDGDRTNNTVGNLMWCTAKENSSHKKVHGTAPIGERNPKAKLKEADVLSIKSLCKKGVDQSEIANTFGVNRRTVSAINCGVNWSHLKECV